MKSKKTVTRVLKFVFVFGLLTFLFKKGFISLHDTQKAFTQWRLLLPAFLVMLLNTGLGIVRWQWLLRAHDICLPWRRTAQLTLVGNFFNVALPGAVSGDFVKAFYIGREMEGRRASAFGSILFDRVAGLSALAIVSAGALLLGLQDFKGTLLLSALRVVVTGAAIAVLAFYTYLFLVREKHDPLLVFFKTLEKRFERAGSLTRIYQGLRHYHHHRWVVLRVLLLSIVIHLLVGWSCLQFAQALGDFNLPLVSTYVVVPLGLLVTAIPILPAGVGTGHAAFLYLFHLMGSDRGADVFTLLALVNLIIGGIGGMVYLRFRGHEPAPNTEPGTQAGQEMESLPTS